ncbi:MAG TPA: YkgJ family cysteine cluster protein [Candidatus Obscuribacterales bacterium]
MPVEESTSVLHLPEGINYECTGCGKCCGGWSVPMTQEDYERISEVDWAKLSPRYEGRSLFRELRPYESEGTPYAYAIKEGDDGHCPFLVDNLCFIHSKFEAKTKPSICQLFPYCFNETPSGVYATVSFVSMGVVNNSGKALAEQRGYLEGKLEEFRTLFPDHHPNWSKLQLAVGKEISWEQYLELETEILRLWGERKAPIEERFSKISDYLISKLERPSSATNTGQLALKPLDKHLLVALHKIYFPVKKLGRGEGDFNTFRFLYQVAFQGVVPGLKIAVPGKSYDFEKLKGVSFPGDADVEDLIYRYFYSRIFGKLYFGAGFGQLSVITGFHHLVLLYALLKLQSKALALSRGAKTPSYLDIVAAVRQMEKRVGETNVGGYAAAVYELLMFSPGRVKRVLANC